MKDYMGNRIRSRVRYARRTKQQTRRLCRKLRPIMTGLLETKAQQGAKAAIDEALELERDEFLGRDRHVRTPDPTSFRGHRNGYYDRTVTLGSGQVEIAMPKVAGGPQLLESQILPPYLRTSPAILETLPELYLHGLSGGDFRPALTALLGEKAVLSASSIARLRARWHEEYLLWHQEPLASHYAYVYADGVYLKVGSAPDKLALLVVIGVDGNGQKRLLAMLPGHRESYVNWLDVMRNLASRGVSWVGLVIADGIAGLWRAVQEVFPTAAHQRDWVHALRNVLEKLPQDKSFQKRALRDLQKIYQAATRAEANYRFRRFAEKYQVHDRAVRCLLDMQKDLTAYFDFPQDHWRHIKTSNPIESTFDPIKMRLRKARRLVLETSATGMVFQLMLKRQARWFRLTNPALAGLVIAGMTFRDGKQVNPGTKAA